MKSHLSGLLSGLAVLSAGGVLLAVSATASAPAATSARSASAATYTVDATHSSVVFRTRHLGVADFFGRFNAVSGEIVQDDEDPTGSSVKLEIPVASIDTNNDGRDDHLRNADFFSAKEYPKMVFESTSVAKDGENLKVTGNLTVRDTTKEIVADVRKVGEAEAMGAYRAGYSTQFELDMRDYGFQFVEQQPGAVGPEVEIWIALELTRQ